jgi:hypothetical protein
MDDGVLHNKGGSYSGPSSPPYIHMHACECGYRVAVDFIDKGVVDEARKKL